MNKELKSIDRELKKINKQLKSIDRELKQVIGNTN